MITDKLISEKPQASLPTLARWCWRALRGFRRRLAGICALGVLRVAASLTFVWVSKVLIDAATQPATPVATLWLLAAALAGCMLAELALSQWRGYVSTLTQQRLGNALRRRLFSHLLTSDLYADRRHSGDFMSRLTADVSTVISTAASTVPNILVMAVQLVGAFWLLCAMSPMLALCALLISPLCIIASKAYMLKMRRINAAIRQGESQLQTQLQEGLQHRMVVQTLECEPQVSSRYAHLQETVLGHVLWRARVGMFSSTTVRVGFIAGYLVAFVWSVFGLHSGAVTFGVMTAFLQLVGRIQGPISSLSNTLPSLVSTATALDRLIEIYPDLDQADADADSPAGAALGAPVGISVRDVAFSYPGANAMIFDGFSHEFAPGSKTVIMGPTGVGKSTLTKLILALLRPQRGSVEAYGIGGRQCVSAATRRYMTYVPQGNSLLHGTIRDNLLLGNARATDAQMRAALDIAVANFVYELPDGLDSECGELGGELSEGQCQRIAIARALLRECPVMILDEFNSSLDASTAALLLQRLMAARPQATIIFISHRPEVATYCDSVLRLG